MKPAVATTGTTRQRLTESVLFSEDNRRQVKLIRASIRQQKLDHVNRQLRTLGMTNPTQRQVHKMLDKFASENPEFKDAVSDEKWGIQLSIMYSLLMLVEQGDVQVQLLTEVRDELRRLAQE